MKRAGVIMNLLPRIHHVDAHTKAIKDKAMLTVNYSKDLYNELQLTQLEMIRKYTSLVSGNSSEVTKLTHLQATSFDLSQTKLLFKRKSRPSSQNINSG